MKHIYILIAIGISAFVNLSWGQNERVNWHFGPTSAGLYFDLGAGTVNPVYNYYSPYYNSGNSVVNSSVDGSLIFYTDGMRVVDANHQLMPNATGLLSSTAGWGAGTVVPFPNDCNKYYVFSMTTYTSASPPTHGNLYYSVVDMSLPGNGTMSVPLGDVVTGQKNIMVGSNVGEGIEYAYNPAGNNYWLFIPTFNEPSSTNSIQVFKIDNSGVSFQSSYPIGVPMYDIQGCNYNQLYNKLFIASNRENDPCLLLDFNLSTGNFTATNSIPGTPFGSSNNLYSGVMACEWSSDWTKLYMGKMRCYAPVYGAGHIYQYDMNLPSQAPILLYTPPNASNYNDLIEDLRRGPDGKIYFTYLTSSNPGIYLGAINSPNTPGVGCNVNDQQVYFSTSFGSAWELSRFVKRSNATIQASNDTTICEGSTLVLHAQGGSSYEWSGGGISSSLDSVSVSPTSTTTYYVTALSQNCGSSTSDTITVMVDASNVSAGPDQTICSGSQVTLNASGATSYSWNNGVTNGVPFTPPSGTTIYTVTGTNSNGCTSTDQVSITVGSPITVNAGNDTSICSGSSIVLSGTGAGTGGTYSWNNGISNGVSFIPTGTATYTVTGTSSAGCTDSDQITVTVNPLPAVNAGPDQTICSGSQAVLNASGATSYSWNNGVTDGVPFTPPTGINTYTVTGTNSNGCVSTDQVNVNVGASIPVNAGSDVAICMGGSVTLNGSGAGIGGTYTWSNGVTNGVSFSPIASATYTVTGTASGGCIGSDQVTVTVNPLPIINAGSDQTICSGEQAVLNGSGGVSYSWNNGVNNGASFSPPIGTTNYTVTGTDANGCVNTDNVSITVNPSPNMNAGPDQSICIGGTVVLTASGTGAVSYSWNNGVQNGVAFSPSITQSYILTGTGANGCTDTDSVTVTVNPLPNINVNDTAVCIGQQLVLQGNGAVNYSWSNGIQNGIAFVPDSGSTTYIVTGTDANGCVSSDTMTVTASSHPNAAFTAAPTSGDQPLVVDITNTSTGATTYYWDFGNGTTQTTFDLGGLNQTYYNEGTYYIILTADNNGCIDTAMAIINVEIGALSYHIPNILTPNGDGQNDIFHFNLVNAAAVDIEIYNRWGNWMQSIKDIQNANGWNGKTSQGKDADEGTYFFTYVITDLHGKTVKGHGFVELVRK